MGIIERPGAPKGSQQFELPCGIVRADGIARDVTIKPMDGEVRRLMGKEVMKEDGIALSEAILHGCVHEIAGGPMTRQIAKELLNGDIDFIALKVAAIGSNAPLVVDQPCAFAPCKGRVYAEMPPDVIEVWTLEQGTDGESPERPEQRELWDWKQYWDCTRDGVSYGGQKRDGVRCFRIKDTDAGLDAVFRYPTGYDQAALDAQVNPEEDPFGFLYALYGMCLLEYNGTSVPDGQVGFGTKWIAKQIPVEHLEIFDDEFPERIPGPEQNQPVVCPKCKRENPIKVSVTGFLLQGRRSKSRRKRRK